MGIVAKGSPSNGDFAPPPTGILPALCIDIIDQGMEDTPYGRKHKIRIVWQLHDKDDDGSPQVRDDGKPWRLSKYYTLSLNEAATLRADLESWRGKPFLDQELAEGFDVEKLLFIPCQLHLAQMRSKKSGKEFVGVKTVLPKARNQPKITPHPDFTRECDKVGGEDVRSPKETPANRAAVSAIVEEEDSDLPF